MFPYDATLAAAVRTPAQFFADVLRIIQTIADTCIDGDGLKWFNWLYQQVTQAVAAREASGGFADTTWLGELDVRFARLYFGALESELSGQRAPGCWRALFERRGQTAARSAQQRLPFE